MSSCSPWLVALALVVVACRGSEPDCLERIEELEPDEEAGPYDLSADLVMGDVSGAYSAILTWREQSSRPTISLQIEDEVLGARFVFSDINRASTAHTIRSCRDRLEVDVQIRVWTDDGAVEHGDLATLRAEGPSSHAVALSEELGVDIGGQSGLADVIAVVEPGSRSPFRGSIGREDPAGNGYEELAWWPLREQTPW